MSVNRSLPAYRIGGLKSHSGMVGFALAGERKYRHRGKKRGWPVRTGEIK